MTLSKSIRQTILDTLQQLCLLNSTRWQLHCVLQLVKSSVFNPCRLYL